MLSTSRLRVHAQAHKQKPSGVLPRLAPKLAIVNDIGIGLIKPLSCSLDTGSLRPYAQFDGKPGLFAEPYAARVECVILSHTHID